MKTSPKIRTSHKCAMCMCKPDPHQYIKQTSKCPSQDTYHTFSKKQNKNKLKATPCGTFFSFSFLSFRWHYDKLTMHSTAAHAALRNYMVLGLNSIKYCEPSVCISLQIVWKKVSTTKLVKVFQKSFFHSLLSCGFNQWINSSLSHR